MKFLNIFLMGVLTLTSFVSFAGGKVVGSGGDGRALEFSESAKAALSDIQKDSASYPELKLKIPKLLGILDKVQILVSEVPVYSMKNGVQQFSTAINYHDPDTIVIYGYLWSFIKNAQIRKALALHEILGLAGIEETGNYSISKRYLNQLGIHCPEGLCETIPRYNCALIKNFKTIPEYLSTGILGNSGADNEILDLKSGSMKASVVMNARSGQGLIMLLLYQMGWTVNTMELHGSAFPPVIYLDWKDSAKNETWSVYCTQN